MSWEDRFSTMVKESSEKIDEAKRRLHSFDNSYKPSMKNSYLTSAAPLLSPPAFQSTPHTRASETVFLRGVKANGFLDDLPLTSPGTSTALLHSLYEKIQQQCQAFELLKSKVETLETGLSRQQKEMQLFKERLSEVLLQVESFKPENDHHTNFEEFRNEIRSALDEIKNFIPHSWDDNDDPQWKTTTSERLHPKESQQVLSTLEEINGRLDKIESDLSSNQQNVERNSKMAEKNVTLLSDWKDENVASMNRLCKLQDLSVDEVKHLRSKLYDVQDKIQDLETSFGDVRLRNEFLNRQKSNSFHGKDDINKRVKPSYTSISSDEEESLSHSPTNSSVNLDGSGLGDLSQEINELNLEGNSRQRTRSLSSGSDLLRSSLNSLTGSDVSLSEI